MRTILRIGCTHGNAAAKLDRANELAAKADAAYSGSTHHQHAEHGLTGCLNCRQRHGREDSQHSTRKV